MFVIASFDRTVETRNNVKVEKHRKFRYCVYFRKSVNLSFDKHSHICYSEFSTTLRPSIDSSICPVGTHSNGKMSKYSIQNSAIVSISFMANRVLLWSNLGKHPKICYSKFFRSSEVQLRIRYGEQTVAHLRLLSTCLTLAPCTIWAPPQLLRLGDFKLRGCAFFVSTSGVFFVFRFFHVFHYFFRLCSWTGHGLSQVVD